MSCMGWALSHLSAAFVGLPPVCYDGNKNLRPEEQLG
jgi:hypothetical protein